MMSPKPSSPWGTWVVWSLLIWVPVTSAKHRFFEALVPDSELEDFIELPAYPVNDPSAQRLTCARSCTVETNCAAFASGMKEDGQAVCRLASDPGLTGRLKASKSQIYFRITTNVVDPPTVYATKLATCWNNTHMLSTDGLRCLVAPNTSDSDRFWHYFDGMAYIRLDFSASPKTLDQAQAVCALRNATLPSPYPQAKTYRALKWVMNSGDSFFLGFNRTGNASLHTFLVATGVIMDAKKSSTDPSQHWDSGQPNASSTASGDAVVMTANGWDDVPSATTTVEQVICSKNSGFEFHPATGMYYWKEMSVKLKKIDADRACQRRGAQLAVTSGPEGLAVIQNYSEPTKVYWVAGARKPGTQIFVFPNGLELDGDQKLTDSSRQNWAGGNPAGWGDCIQIWNGYWDDYPCGTQMNFLCERDF